MERFRYFAGKVSKNNTKQCWILKCDIKKFFATIDHDILLQILIKYLKDQNIPWLLERIITSFETNAGKGLPLGNLTSQLLVNVYMNEFDQFVKHQLKAKYYIRYADDFVFLHGNKEYLSHTRDSVNEFLEDRLKLSLHPDKVFVKSLFSGVDFLGWVHFPNHRVLRTTTKKRLIRNFSEKSASSYLGMLKHGNTYKLESVVNLKQ